MSIWHKIVITKLHALQKKKKIQIDMPSRTTSPFMNYKKSHGFHKSHARRKNLNHSTADQHEEHDADLSRRAPLTN